MSINEKAQSLAQEIAQTSEYEELKNAEQVMHADEEAKDLLDDYQSTQKRLQMAQSNGQQVSSKQQKKLQNLQAKMQSNDKIKKFMEKQQEFNQLMQNVNQIISKELEENAETNTDDSE